MNVTIDQSPSGKSEIGPTSMSLWPCLRKGGIIARNTGGIVTRRADHGAEAERGADQQPLAAGCGAFELPRGRRRRRRLLGLRLGLRLRRARLRRQLAHPDEAEDERDGTADRDDPPADDETDQDAQATPTARPIGHTLGPGQLSLVLPARDPPRDAPPSIRGADSTAACLGCQRRNT